MFIDERRFSDLITVDRVVPLGRRLPALTSVTKSRIGSLLFEKMVWICRGYECHIYQSKFLPFIIRQVTSPRLSVNNLHLSKPAGNNLLLFELFAEKEKAFHPSRNTTLAKYKRNTQ